jgi:predicted YcjX-like family ATPase
VPGYTTPLSLAGLLSDRFEAYKADIRAQFFDTCFADFDRQILLVDVLSALCAGKEAFEDTERAIADIAAQLRYGSSWLPRPVAEIAGGAAKIAGGGHSLAGHGVGAFATARASDAIAIRRIERVAFVTTKADYVPSMLKNLLRDLVETARPNERGSQQVTYHTVASVLSTEDDIAEVNGRPVEVVPGVPLGEERRRASTPARFPSAGRATVSGRRPFSSCRSLRHRGSSRAARRGSLISASTRC